MSMLTSIYQKMPYTGALKTVDDLLVQGAQSQGQGAPASALQARGLEGFRVSGLGRV